MEPKFLLMSPEDTVRYSRHCRKAVISLWSPSLVLLVIGSTPPSSSNRSCPVAQLQPTLLMWHPATTLASGSLFPSDWLVLSAVAAYAVGRAGYKGFRPTASAPYWACTPTGGWSSGHTVFSVGRHTLTKCWLSYGSPARDFGLPFA